MPLTGDDYSRDLTETLAAVSRIDGSTAMFFTYAIREKGAAEARIFVATIHKASVGEGYRVLVKDRTRRRVVINDVDALVSWISQRAWEAESFHAVIRETNRGEAAKLWREAR